MVNFLDEDIRMTHDIEAKPFADRGDDPDCPPPLKHCHDREQIWRQRGAPSPFFCLRKQPTKRGKRKNNGKPHKAKKQTKITSVEVCNRDIMDDFRLFLGTPLDNDKSLLPL